MWLKGIAKILRKKPEEKKEIPGIYDVPESKEYSRSQEYRKTGYISVRIAGKPGLESFFGVGGLDSGAEAGKFKEDIAENCYYSPKLEILLQCSDGAFTAFGKCKRMLKYLEKDYPQEHLRLHNYLEHGIDSEQVKEWLLAYGSPECIKGYEDLTGIKLEAKEKGCHKNG